MRSKSQSTNAGPQCSGLQEPKTRYSASRRYSDRPASVHDYQSQPAGPAPASTRSVKDPSNLRSKRWCTAKHPPTPVPRYLCRRAAFGRGSAGARFDPLGAQQHQSHREALFTMGAGSPGAVGGRPGAQSRHAIPSFSLKRRVHERYTGRWRSLTD